MGKRDPLAWPQVTPPRPKSNRLRGMEPVISRVEPLAQQVRDFIYEQIISGAIDTDETYSVSELSQQLGVSRTPVREAILQLEEIGLVTIIRNKGFRAVEVSAEEIVSAFQLRYLLEPFCASSAANLDDVSGVVGVLEGHMGEMARASDASDRKAFMQADRDFHDALLGVAGNTRLTRAVNGARDATYTRGLSTYSADRTWTMISDEHERILEAVRQGNASAAAEAMREHICSTGEHLLRRMGSDPEGDWLGVEAGGHTSQKAAQ